MELRGLSSDGQLAIDNKHYAGTGNKYSTRSYVYSSAGASPIRVPSLDASDVTSLDFGRLSYSNGKSIVVRDLATGKSTIYPGFKSPDQVSVDAAGRVLTVTTEVKSGKKGRYLFKTRINAFAPGSTKPSATIYRRWFDTSTLIFCGDGFAEFSEPRKGPMLLTLRSFDGAVIKRLKGPPTGLEYDGQCAGRHLTLAAIPASGTFAPKIYGYDF
jgi:hypothetical protein